MDAMKAVKLMREYNHCRKCGSDKVGNGAGAIIIDDDVLIRSCRCEWTVIATESEGVIEGVASFDSTTTVEEIIEKVKMSITK